MLNSVHMYILLDKNSQCTSLLGHKNHLYVGTSSGKVEVYDSESGCFLQQFAWHSSKVNALIELPPEIKQSICAESKMLVKKVQHHSLVFDSNSVANKMSLHEPPNNLSHYSTPGEYPVPAKPVLLNSPLIISLGDDLAERLNIGDENVEHRVNLLTWTGYPTN